MPDTQTTPAPLERGPQLCDKLPEIHRFVTGHNAEGKAVSKEDVPVWTHLGNKTRGYNVLYTTQEFPAVLDDDKDIKAHDELLESGKLGLVTPNGTVLRIVDFAPGKPAAMHRTQSLDYGIVLEGEIVMVLDSGEEHRMKRGDVAIQRATFHAWKNESQTEWCRMAFVLMDCNAPVVNGKVIGEDLGKGLNFLPSSR